MYDQKLNAYTGFSAVLYVLYVSFSALIVITLIWWAVAYVSGWMAVVIGFLVYIIASRIAFGGFQKLKTLRSDGEFSRRFAGWRGHRVPIFHLLEYNRSGHSNKFSDKRKFYSLGESAELLFLIENAEDSNVEQLIGGAVVRMLASGLPITIRKAEIVDVQIIERSDNEIAESAIDKRDWGDRFGSFVAQRLTGTKVRTKIVPFAAYVVVNFRDGYLISAIPTTVTFDMVKGMLQAIDTAEFVTHAVGKIQSAVVTEVTDQVTDHGRGVLGDNAADFVHSGAELLGDAKEAMDEVTAWVDPDAATIASTVGEGGRQAARLIGNWIRSHSSRS